MKTKIKKLVRDFSWDKWYNENEHYNPHDLTYINKSAIIDLYDKLSEEEQFFVSQEEFDTYKGTISGELYDISSDILALENRATENENDISMINSKILDIETDIERLENDIDVYNLISIPIGTGSEIRKIMTASSKQKLSNGGFLQVFIEETSDDNGYYNQETSLNVIIPKSGTSVGEQLSQTINTAYGVDLFAGRDAQGSIVITSGGKFLTKDVVIKVIYRDANVNDWENF